MKSNQTLLQWPNQYISVYIKNETSKGIFLSYMWPMERKIVVIIDENLNMVIKKKKKTKNKSAL